MKNNDLRRMIPVIAIPLGGLLGLAIVYGSYAGIYLFLETIIKPTEAFVSKTDLFRSIFAALVVLGYLILYRLKMNEILKAVLMVGPVAMFLITLALRYYANVIMVVTVCGLAVASIAYLLNRDRKAWYFYYALGIAAIVALLYAWPR